MVIVVVKICFKTDLMARLIKTLEVLFVKKQTK